MPPSLRPQQRHRNSEGVINQHLLTRRDVELVGNQRFDQMPRKLRMARVWRHDWKAPAFIRILVLRCGADGEGWHLVEEEVEPVIVVDDDSEIRLHAVEPCVDWPISVEERFPKRIVLQPAGDSLADRRNMRCRDTANDSSHLLVTSCANQHFFELFFSHTALLSSNLLHIHAEYAGPFGEVVDVASGFEQFAYIPML